MSYDPSIGRWTTQDPIAFESGDANLYRFVGNDPTNATDPTGLKMVKGTEPIDTILKNQVSDDEKKILEALVNNDLYKQMIKVLEDSDQEFEIRIDPDHKEPFQKKQLKVPGVTRRSRNQDPTAKDRNRVLIFIDPKFQYPGYPKGKPNPAELADTILHELMHAILLANNPSPLLPGGMDASHDPRLMGLGLSTIPMDADNIPKDHLDKNYGPEPIYPDLMYSDINRELQKQLAKELKRIRDKAGVGGPTLTERGLK